MSPEKHRERLTWHYHQGVWKRQRPARRNEIFGNAMMAAKILIYK
jgi:hypothetical protein